MKRLDLAGRIVSAALACAILLTPELWTTHRTFPVLPVLLPTLPSAVEQTLFAALLAVLFAHAAGALTPALPRAAVTLVLALLLQDGFRAQPWLYEYLLMLSILAAAPGDPDGAVAAMRLVFSSVYLWSGLHKLNVTFPAHIAPWLAQPLLARVPEALPAVHGAASAAPLLEASFGVMLWSSRTRRFAVAGIAAMHILLLAALGPAGLGWNLVVWPWNGAMIGLVLVLFRQGAEPGADAWEALGRTRRLLIPVGLAAVLPALSFIGAWPAYLSWALYSGDTYKAVIEIPVDAVDTIPETLKQSISEMLPGPPAAVRFDPVSWMEAETGAVPPPERHTYAVVLDWLCAELPPGTVRLYLFDPPERLSGNRVVEVASCPLKAAAGG